MPEWSIPSEVPMGEESPRLSTGSSFSSECLSTGTMSDSSILIGGDLPENERPMSLVSTVSSSSNSSKEEQSLYRIYTPLLGSTHSMDLEPGPSEQPRLPSLGDDSDEGGTHYTVQVPKNNNATEHTWTDHSTQSHCSSSTAKSMAPSTKLSYLDRVVMEIVETERTYVRDLRSIVEDYLAHIIDTADLPILPEQVGALFGNIEDIYEFNSELLQTLDMCDNDPVAIARCFVHKTEYFEIYTQYCTNYPNSVAVLTECMRSKTLSDFFRDRQAMLEHSLPLGSYLLKPVQRILKYHLLLQEIAKHFDPEEEGYEEVEEAIYTMTGVAWYINDMKRKHEHAVRLQEVQSLLINWKGPDLTTYGELVLEGTFRVHHSKNERTFFLFERMLLITKKRGEHYVYKTHISCATLMLIESAKDSLCFSVTHYRHPKQPHTVQAKTVEERKLWAFHIKRLILENHQAIIPQKAKDAFQMDSIYPKYRYSPDRLKKAMSWQPDDLTAGVHLRRGQSDPAKQTLQGTKDILKTDHSAGVLGFSLPEPEAERPDMEKETEKMGLRKDSFERQISAESNEPISGLPDLKAGREEEKEWETDSEDIFLEDDQMEDFASSMLAAISCWHYRVRALLSTGAATDKEEDGIMEDKLNIENNQPSCQDESCVTSLDGSLAHQDTSNGALPHSPASQPDLKERPEEDLSSDLPVISRSSLVTPGFRDGQAAEKQKPDHVTQQAGQKRISSEDSGSEDEEESRPDSILPSSVLGQASVIAEHFLTSTRRGSLHSLAGPCHMHTSRSGSAISLNTEFLEKVHRLHSNPTELRQILCHQDSTHTLDTTMIPPRANSLFDGNGMPIRRQDSSLSRQDQLLIDKIRSYYENAEYKEASFSGQRRESLTFIPTGLVQDSVRQLNNIPKDEVVVRETESVLPIISASSTSSLSTTGNANDTSRSGKKQHSKFCDFGAKSFVGSQDSVHKSQIFQGIHLGDKEFQPYNKTVDVWREKEREFGRSLKKPKGAVEPRLGGSHSSGASLGMRHTSQTTSKIPMTRHLESLVVFKNMDLDGCIDPQRILGHADNRDETQIQCSVRQDYIPRPASCQINVEEVMQMQDEKAKTKVFQLARQYSQLAKTTERIPEQNGRDSADLHKDNVPSVLKERLEDENRVLPRSPSPVTSHRDRSPSYTCPKSPASPTQTESFNWPDVRELRSKYTIQEPEHAKDALEPLPWTLGRGHRRCSSSSSTFVFSQAQADTPQRWESCRQRICSDESLDRGLFELPKAHGTERCPSSSHAVEEKVVVVADQADRAEVCKEGGGAQGELRKGRHLNYGQTGSPTFHEKSSAMAYTEHDRTDQQREECRQWEHGNAIGPLATRRRERRKRDQGLTMHKHLEHTQKTVIKESDTGQPSKVKDLREKFLSMTYNSYTL